VKLRNGGRFQCNEFQLEFNLSLHSNKPEKMGISSFNNTIKTKPVVVKSKDSKLRQLIMSTEIKPLSKEEHNSIRLNAYKAVR
jgi:hypothetical protein